MKRATTRVMKHNMILNGEMAPMHRREGCMKDQEFFSFFQLPQYPISSGYLVSPLFIISCTPPPLLRNSRDEISFKGEGCNTLCYGSIIKSLKLQLSLKARVNQVIKV
jgi:hypothetical protein